MTKKIKIIFTCAQMRGWHYQKWHILQHFSWHICCNVWKCICVNMDNNIVFKQYKKNTMLPLCTTGDQICNALFKTKALPVWWGVASGLGRRQQGLLFFRIHYQLYVIEIQIPQKVYWSRNAHFTSEKKRIRCYNQCFLLIINRED